MVSIVEMDDGCLMAGDRRYTVEPNGNCGDGIYTYDCYLMKCDIEGNVIWDKEFGGSCNDKMVKVLHNSIDNGFTAFTNSKSMDGDVESFANLGVIGNDEGNIWMFHVDAEGHLLWEYCIGSQLGLWEEIRDVVAVGDGEYAIVGINTWFNGVSSGLVNCSNNLLLPNSGSNIWALHVTDIYDYDGIGEPSIIDRINLTPNPTTGMVTITGENLRQAEVVNMLGQQVLSTQGEGNTLRIDMATLPVGVYFVTVTDTEGRKCVRKVVRE